MRPWRGLVVMALLAGCGADKSSGGDTTGPPPTPEPVDPGPANAVIVNAAANGTFGQYDVHVRNDGGAGTYRLEFWTLRTSPNGDNNLWANTEPVDVDTSYDETVTYQLFTEPQHPPLYYILAFTRDQGSAVYRQTDSVQTLTP